MDEMQIIKEVRDTLNQLVEEEWDCREGPLTTWTSVQSPPSEMHDGTIRPWETHAKRAR